jgi:hypothetical protein
VVSLFSTVRAMAFVWQNRQFLDHNFHPLNFSP